MSDSNDFDSQYKLLRNWYLANLRKGALAQRTKLQMTPAALMAADKEALFSLAQSAAKASTENEASTDAPVKMKTIHFLSIWIFTTACFWLWLVVDLGGDFTAACRYFIFLVAGVWFDNKYNLSALMPFFVILPVLFYGIPVSFVVYKLAHCKWFQMIR